MTLVNYKIGKYGQYNRWSKYYLGNWNKFKVGVTKTQKSVLTDKKEDYQLEIGKGKPEKTEHICC